MADISKIKLGNTTYNIKDEVARQTMSGAITLKGETTTVLADNSTTNPITIDGEQYTAKANDAVFYSGKEFVFDGTKWHEFGDMSGLGALATKDSASASYTPKGTVSKPTFTGNSSAVTITATDNASGNYQPKGTVSQPTFTGSSSAVTITATDNANGNYQPKGTNSGGGYTSPTSANVYSITNVGTLPTLTTTVTNETLEISFSQGTLPTRGAAQSVVTGLGTFTNPIFTGTKAQIAGTTTAAGSVSQPTFTGTKTQLAGTTTASGEVSQPTFTGTGETITVS